MRGLRLPGASEYCLLDLESLWDDRNRTAALIASAVLTVVIAIIDWKIKTYLSLGLLYLFPIILAAGFLARWQIAFFGALCGMLAEWFAYLPFSYARLGFEMLGFAGSGLFLSEMLRGRRMLLQSEQRLTALVETSPAAILTVNQTGLIELANRAALELLQPRDGVLAGLPIATFVPELDHALRWERAPRFRTSMECRALRGNGESFSADVWFSTYQEGAASKLAAILAEIPATAEEPGPQPGTGETRSPLTDRELGVLRYLVQGLTNKEIAAQLDLSESTVKNTLQQLFTKGGVRSRAQLVRVALEHYRDLL